MFMAIITLLTALSISAVAIYYSILGLAAIFAGAAIPIMVMGSVLEVGKLVTASWLYQNWKVAPRFIKAYLSIAVVVLMFITSMGIFGFLSKAHVEQTSLGTIGTEKLATIDEKLLRSENRIERWSVDIERLVSGEDVRVDVLVDKEQVELDKLYARIDSEKQALRDQADKDIELQNNRLKQAQERKEADIAAAQERYKGAFSKKGLDEAIAKATANELAVASAAQKIIVEIQNKLKEDLAGVDAKYADQIAGIEKIIQDYKNQANTKTGDIEGKIIELENLIEAEQDKIDQVNEDKIVLMSKQAQLEVEVGPLKYIAEFVYGQEANQNLLEAAVRWVIIIIIVVFDPLAVLLLIAANMSFIRRFGRGFEKQYDDSLVKRYSEYEQQRGKKIAENVPPEIEDTEPTEDVDDLKKRHEKELDKFREKLSQAEQELQEQLDYQKDLEEKPQKTVINIDESVNINPTDEVEKKKD
jgi:hypothetical protein